MSISNAELSDMIGAIYDCALDPELWPETIKRITAAVDAAAGFITLHDFQNNLGGRLFEHGIPESELRRYFNHYAPLNPIVPVAETREVGQVDTLATMFFDDTWDKSAFNQEWILPLGLRDVLGILCLRSGRRAGWLGALRPAALGDYGEAEVKLFRLLSPHVCRSLKISDLLDMRSIASDRLAETLDGLASPVFLLDIEGRVVHRNEAAERLLERHRSIAVRNGRITVEGAAGQVLTTTISRNLSGEISMPDQPYTLALGDGVAGKGLVATVLPLGRRETISERIRRPWAAAAALFIQEPEAASMAGALKAFAVLYDISPAEERLLAVLANGGGLPTAAAALGVAPSTVRTQLNSVFAKAGVSSQAELVQRIMACQTPVRL